jgi:hypothetical protein
MHEQGMHAVAGPAGARGDRARPCIEATEQAGRDIVAVVTATRRELAFEGVRIQSFERQRCIGNSALAATSAATAEAADPPMPEPRAMPFSISSATPNVGIDGMSQQRGHGACGRVAFGIQRQSNRQATNAAHANAWVGADVRCHAVSGAFERMSDQVEPDRTIADAGRRKRGCRRQAHTRAPR